MLTRAPSRSRDVSRRRRSGPPPALTLAALSLSASSIAEGASPGAPVGELLGRTAGSTLSLLADAGGRFALSGANIVAGLTPTDFETNTSHSITVREVLAGATNTPRDTILTITVTDVAEGGTTTASSVTERGVTLTFWDAATGGNPRSLPVRQYHDGSWAVTHDGGPVWVDVAAPTYQLLTGLPVNTEYPSGTRAINGLMVNPGAAYVSGSRGANGLGTPGDLAANDIGTLQGYDSRVASSTALLYDAALNYHPGRTGARLRYDPGQEATLAVAVSIPSPSTQTNLQEVVYVTICNTLPPVGSLRPAPAAISKASPGLVADLDLTVLPNDARPPFTLGGSALDPTVANAYGGTRLPNLMIQYTTGNNAETISPSSHHAPYGRDVARPYNIALSLLCENISSADKRSLAGNIAQIAHDHFERIVQGGVFYANGQRALTTAGGHDQWRLPLCAIAARMMRLWPRYAEFAGYVGNMFLWPEPRQIGRVSIANTYDTTSGVHAGDGTAGEPQGGARKQARAWHVGMPEFIPNGNVRWGKAYRGINDPMMSIGLVNLHRVSGAAALIPAPALQLMVDYAVTRTLDYWRAGFTEERSTRSTASGTTTSRRLTPTGRSSRRAPWPARPATSRRPMATTASGPRSTRCSPCRPTRPPAHSP